MRSADWRRGVVVFAVTAAFVVCGCASRPPFGSTPSPSESMTDGYGSWILACDLEGDCHDAGELLSASPDTIWILTDSAQVRPVALQRLKVVQVFKYLPSTMPVGLAVLGGISTLSHGYFLVFSAPAWIVTGVTTSYAERAAARMEVRPAEWARLRPYCRWPAGWPQGVSSREVLPKKYSGEPRVVPEKDAWPTAR